jgi:sec-independent protein translocase protein TatC
MGKPEGELRMSFWSHLDELRKRLVYSAAAIGVGFILCFNYSEEILGLLLLPMNSTVSYSLSFPFILFTPNKLVQDLYFTTLIEPIMSHLKIGFIAGMMLMIPIILYQVWKFISPGLLPVERKYAGQFVFFATFFLRSGFCSAFFCFFPLLFRSS